VLLSGTTKVGHLQQVFHISSYLKVHSCSRIVLDPTKPLVNLDALAKEDWSEFYPGTKESIPLNALEASGTRVLTTAFVDAITPEI
jgi:hypothetical protein